jgi:hypothetical protein
VNADDTTNDGADAVCPDDEVVLYGDTILEGDCVGVQVDALALRGGG